MIWARRAAAARGAATTARDVRRASSTSLDALRGEPFSGKADLRDGYPFGLLRVPVSSLARLHASSGTHGKPTVVGYTAQTSRRGQS